MYVLAGTFCHWEYRRLLVAGAGGLHPCRSLRSPPGGLLPHSDTGRSVRLISQPHHGAGWAVPRSGHEPAHLLDHDRYAHGDSYYYCEPADYAGRRTIVGAATDDPSLRLTPPPIRRGLLQSRAGSMPLLSNGRLKYDRSQKDEKKRRN